MRTVITSALTATVLALLPAVATAEVTTDQTPPGGFAKEIERNGLSVESAFTTKDTTGFILRAANGQPITAYQPNGSENVIVGSMMGPNGEDISDAHLQKHVYGKAALAAWKTLDASPELWIERGDESAPYFYSFDDPSNSYSARQYRNLEDLVRGGKLRVRHVLVSTAGNKNRSVAAGILEKGDPAAAWHDAAVREDTIPSKGEISEEVSDQLERHADLMKEAGLEGIPGLLIPTESGAVEVHTGLMGGEEILTRMGQE